MYGRYNAGHTENYSIHASECDRHDIVRLLKIINVGKVVWRQIVGLEHKFNEAVNSARVGTANSVHLKIVQKERRLRKIRKDVWANWPKHLPYAGLNKDSLLLDLGITSLMTDSWQAEQCAEAERF